MLKQTLVKLIFLNMVLVIFSWFSNLQSADAVEAKGVNRTVLGKALADGLTEGKYKMRAVEVTIEPGGSMSEHTHAGPGLRYVISGTLSSQEDGKTKIYTAGQVFAETPQVHHSYKNVGSKPVQLLVFEIVPIGEVEVKAAQEKQGVTSKVTIEAEVDGLTAGKYNMLLFHVVWEPEGFVGEHTHGGPGIRWLASGSLTITEEGTKIYKAGDYYFEPAGSHMARVDADKSRKSDLYIFTIAPAEG